MTHALFLAGIALVVYGVWLMYHPAGSLVAGLLLIALALLLDKQKERSNQ